MENSKVEPINLKVPGNEKLKIQAKKVENFKMKSDEEKLDRDVPDLEDTAQEKFEESPPREISSCTCC